MGTRSEARNWISEPGPQKSETEQSYFPEDNIKQSARLDLESNMVIPGIWKGSFIFPNSSINFKEFSMSGF
jgi:hypothetical protein